MSYVSRYVPGSIAHLTEAPRLLLENRKQAIQSELTQRNKPGSKPRGRRYWVRIESELGYIERELSVRIADDAIINQLEQLLAES